MLIQNISFTLKDGRAAVLRSPREEDIEGTLDYLRASAGETEFIIRYPEECAKYTYEKEKAFFEQTNASPDSAVILCVVGGKIAGLCNITRMAPLKVRHRAAIGIANLQEYWGLGIGTRMFQEMLRIAREEWEGVIQVELEFVEGNSRGRALYEKMGFRITGMRPNAIRLRDGRLRHEYLMALELAQEGN